MNGKDSSVVAQSSWLNKTLVCPMLEKMWNEKLDRLVSLIEKEAE